jgi:hypothetical protein
MVDIYEISYRYIGTYPVRSNTFTVICLQTHLYQIFLKISFKKINVMFKSKSLYRADTENHQLYVYRSSLIVYVVVASKNAPNFDEIKNAKILLITSP